MKKILALILTLVMALSLVACGEKPVETPDEPEYKVAMVTDYGDILQPDHLRGLQGFR